MWTDVFQIIMMFAGLMAVLVQGSIDQEGFSKIWDYMVEGNRTEFFLYDTQYLYFLIMRSVSLSVLF